MAWIDDQIKRLRESDTEVSLTQKIQLHHSEVLKAKAPQFFDDFVGELRQTVTKFNSTFANSEKRQIVIAQEGDKIKFSGAGRSTTIWLDQSCLTIHKTHVGGPDAPESTMDLKVNPNDGIEFQHHQRDGAIGHVLHSIVSNMRF